MWMGAAIAGPGAGTVFMPGALGAVASSAAYLCRLRDSGILGCFGTAGVPVSAAPGPDGVCGAGGRTGVASSSVVASSTQTT